ncbi:unnamed protein product [Parnassius mnemosyne]|uniref:Uncharacterized protein n=1 Tax=Parnassius mnemosyne TaxID=213953 RepID=A0AAV1KWP6_9NEOP
MSIDLSIQSNLATVSHSGIARVAVARFLHPLLHFAEIESCSGHDAVAARSQEVGGVSPPVLGKHVKPLLLRLISLRPCITVPSDYESEAIESARVLTLGHYDPVLRRWLVSVDT